MKRWKALHYQGTRLKILRRPTCSFPSPDTKHTPNFDPERNRSDTPGLAWESLLFRESMVYLICATYMNQNLENKWTLHIWIYLQGMNNEHPFAWFYIHKSELFWSILACRSRRHEVLSALLFRTGKASYWVRFPRGTCYPPIWIDGVSWGWVEYTVALVCVYK